MNWLESSHQILAVLILGTGIAAAVSLISGGERFFGLRRGWPDWIFLLIVGVFLFGMAADLFFIHLSNGGGGGEDQRIWSRGWIGPREQNGAITIGILQDALGLSVALISSVLAASLFSARTLLRMENSALRIRAGVLFGLTGVATAWLSLTPWLSILGMAVAALGGFIVFSVDEKPELMTRFGQEKMLGAILCFLGTAVLSGGRQALVLSRAFSAVFQGISSGFPHVFDLIGGSLLLLGVFAYLQPFPLLGGFSRPTRSPYSSVLVVGQIFSALAAFGLAIRFEPEIRSIGLLPFFGWLGFFSALLAGVTGLAHENWKTALPLWLSSSLSFAFGSLCFSGGETAFSLLLGTTLASAALSLLAGLAERGELKANRMILWKALVMTAGAGGLGAIGFVSSGALVRMMTQAAADPLSLAAFALVLLVSQLLLMKNVFSVLSLGGKKRTDAPGEAQGSDWAFSVILLLMSLGIWWSGTLTGGVLTHDPDRVFASWITNLFVSSPSAVSDESLIVLGQGAVFGVLAVAVALGFWLFGRNEDVILKLLARSPAARRFLREGYDADRAAAAGISGLSRAGKFVETAISEKLSSRWIPLAVERTLGAGSRCVSEADEKAYAAENSAIRQWIEVPAKTLQLIQNGDIQWYVFFGVGIVAAILIHFILI